MSVKRHSLALILSPLAALPATAVFLAVRAGTLEAATGAFFLSFIIVPASYGGLLLLGLPWAALLRWLGLLSATFLVPGAVPMGMIGGHLVGWLVWGSTDWPGFSMYPALGSFVAVAVAVTYASLRIPFWPTNRVPE